MNFNSLLYREASSAFPFHSSTMEMLCFVFAFCLAVFLEMISPASEPILRLAGIASFEYKPLPWILLLSTLTSKYKLPFIVIGYFFVHYSALVTFTSCPYFAPNVSKEQECN